MRKPALKHLREAVRSQITLAFENIGFAKPRDIARSVCQANPQDICELGNALAEDALTEMVRRELKNTSQQYESQLQMMLPGLSALVINLLPPAISIPGSDEVDADDVIYKPLAQVSFAELKAHLGMLAGQITADIRRHRALTELHDMALTMGAVGDSRVFDVLGASEHIEAEVA